MNSSSDPSNKKESYGFINAIGVLISENRAMKKLLVEMLPDIEERVSSLIKLWPRTDVALRRNERFINEIKKIIA